MSNERSRAWRRHQRTRIITKRKDFLRAYGGQEGILEHRPEGKLADRHPFDCGKRCLMCHGDKILDSQARRAEQNRQWEKAHEAGEGEGWHDWASVDYDWSVLKCDDLTDGLPSTLEDALAEGNNGYEIW